MVKLVARNKREGEGGWGGMRSVGEGNRWIIEGKVKRSRS